MKVRDKTLDEMRARYRKIAKNLKEYRDDIDRWNSLHPDEKVEYDDGEIVALLADIRGKFAGKVTTPS